MKKDILENHICDDIINYFWSRWIKAMSGSRERESKHYEEMLFGTLAGKKLSIVKYNGKNTAIERYTVYYSQGRQVFAKKEDGNPINFTFLLDKDNTKGYLLPDKELRAVIVNMVENQRRTKPAFIYRFTIA